VSLWFADGAFFVVGKSDRLLRFIFGCVADRPLFSQRGVFRLEISRGWKQSMSQNRDVGRHVATVLNSGPSMTLP
jgi:hypothetical protein